MLLGERLDGAGNLISGSVRLRFASAGLALMVCGNSVSCRGLRPYDSVSQLTPVTRRSQCSLPQHVSGLQTPVK